MYETRPVLYALPAIVSSEGDTLTLETMIDGTVSSTHTIDLPIFTADIPVHLRGPLLRLVSLTSALGALAEHPEARIQSRFGVLPGEREFITELIRELPGREDDTLDAPIAAFPRLFIERAPADRVYDAGDITHTPLSALIAVAVATANGCGTVRIGNELLAERITRALTYGAPHITA